jgi:hypothetical protein
VVRVLLSGGSYKSRSLIASAQRQVNLYSEPNRPGAIIDIDGSSGGEPESGGVKGGIPILFPTPGLRPLATPPTPGPARGLFWSTSQRLFYVCGATLYNVHADWSMTALGTIAPGTNPVSMADNGLAMILVDGTPNTGYAIDLTSLVMSPINAANNSPPLVLGVFAFPGADRVSMMDGYFILNNPGTESYFASYNNVPTGSGATAQNGLMFDSLWFAGKNGYPDHLVAAIINQRSIWLIGERTTEIHYNAGAAAFPFAVMPGPYVQHGCNAKYSIAQLNESAFWLSQDQTGANIAVKTSGYTVVRISTHAIETEWRTYATTSDARGSCFQQNGHGFWQLDFPTADKSWRYDNSTGEWHEAVWSDTNGAEHRHRAGAIAYAYGVNVAADWQTGALYALDPQVFDDNGAPMAQRRDFPHIVSGMDRVFHRQLIADMAPGNSVGTSSAPPDTSPQLQLLWSDDRGRTFGNPITASMGATGEYLTSIQFQRLGYARDRVYSLRWTAIDTALQGAFLLVEKADS